VLTDARLRYANFENADLSHATLRGADTYQTRFGGAKFCHTTMRNGSINNSGC
jgi:uncharacterized protein YjbI with pentapeptide repeats